MKSKGKDGNGEGTPFVNQQISEDRPSAGIPKAREREGDQGIPGFMTSRLTSQRSTTHGASEKGWSRTEICLWWTVVEALCPKRSNGLR